MLPIMYVYRNTRYLPSVNDINNQRSVESQVILTF